MQDQNDFERIKDQIGVGRIQKPKMC
jgi:hypothetical protein